MFPDYICRNINIQVVISIKKDNFGFHSNQKTEGQKHRVINLNFKYQVCQMKLRHLNTFLQFRLLFHEPHCTRNANDVKTLIEKQGYFFQKCQAAIVSYYQVQQIQ